MLSFYRDTGDNSITSSSVIKHIHSPLKKESLKGRANVLYWGKMFGTDIQIPC